MQPWSQSGTEHEMLDDQLDAAVEKIGERLLAVRPVEDILLLDLDPRQLAPSGAELVAQPGEFLLLDEQCLARGKPLISNAIRCCTVQLLCEATTSMIIPRTKARTVIRRRVDRATVIPRLAIWSSGPIGSTSRPRKIIALGSAAVSGRGSPCRPGLQRAACRLWTPLRPASCQFRDSAERLSCVRRRSATTRREPRRTGPRSWGCTTCCRGRSRRPWSS